MGLNWKELLVQSAMIQSERKHFRVNSFKWLADGVGGVIWKFLFPQPHHGADRPVQKVHNHWQTLPFVRWGSVKNTGEVCRQTCWAASVALRVAYALMEMANSKLESGIHGFSILTLFSAFFSSGVVYNQHISLMNTSLLQILLRYSWACWVNLAGKQEEEVDALKSRQSWCSYSIQFS